MDLVAVAAAQITHNSRADAPEQMPETVFRDIRYFLADARGLGLQAAVMMLKNSGVTPHLAEVVAPRLLPEDA